MTSHRHQDTSWTFDPTIPQTNHDSMYVVMGELRCSLSAARTDSSSHAWIYVDPTSTFSNGADTYAAILHNENYLSILGNDAVSIQQGDAYMDAGAATPDGADIAKSTDLDTMTPGNYTIQYTATKGCGVLDTAVRTIEVEAQVTPNRPPTAPMTTGGTDENVPVTITPAVSDLDGDPFRISAVDDPDNGSVTFSATAIIYTPDQGYFGTDVFNYTVTDDKDTAQGTITVTVRDATAPVIRLSGASSITVELGDAYTEQGAAVTDNDPAYATTEATVGGDAVNADRAGTYTVDYTAPADDAGNSPAPVSRTVTVQDTTKPVITLNGQPDITLQLGDTYAEQGAAVTDNDPAYATTAATVGGDTVDTAATGTYTVRYTAPADGAGNLPDPVVRTVTVQDTNAPVITLNGANPLEHELGDPYTDPGATADDGSHVSADFSQVNVSAAGDYTVTYTATDSSNNTGTATRTVQVRDTLPPTIAITGNNPLVHNLGDLYEDPGAVCN